MDGFVVLWGNTPMYDDKFALYYLRLPERKFTCFGGRLDTEVESLRISVAGKLREQLVDDQGNAILTDIDPDEFRLVSSGVGEEGILWEGYSYQLSQGQVERIERHLNRLFDVPDYKSAMTEKTGGVIEDVWMTSLPSLRGPLEYVGTLFLIPHEAATLNRMASTTEWTA